MHISAAGRYALRAMLDLAEYGSPGPVLRQDLATRQQISGEYLAQLFRPLTQAHLVRSQMGPGGGYQLARPANKVYIGEIIRAVEGPLALVPCLRTLPAAPAVRTVTAVDVAAPAGGSSATAANVAATAAGVAATAAGCAATACPRQPSCTARLLWSRLNRVIEEYLDSISLADLLEEAGSGASPCPDPLETLFAPLDQMTSDCEDCPDPLPPA